MKYNSFNKLCKREREDLTVTASQLAIMVRVAAQEQYLLEKNIKPGELSYTHRALLVKMENSSEKLRLIEHCIKHQWSTRKLDKKLKEINEKKPENTIESFTWTASKYIKKIDNSLKINDSFLNIDDKELASITSIKRKNLAKQINKLKNQTEENSAQSDLIIAGCETLLTKLENFGKDGKKQKTAASPAPADDSTEEAADSKQTQIPASASAEDEPIKDPAQMKDEQAESAPA